MHQLLDDLVDQPVSDRHSGRILLVRHNSSDPPGQRTRGRALGQTVTSRTYTIFRTHSDLPSGPYEPDGQLLLAAIMQSVESEEEEREEPVDNIQGATERDLDLPGLDRLMERPEDYVGQLHRLRQDYAQAIGADVF